MTFITSYKSPEGPVTISSDGLSVTGLWFNGQRHDRRTLSPQFTEIPIEELPVFIQTRNWLDTYFSGCVPDFTPPVSLPPCSRFFAAVSAILQRIPYGQTVTYGQIAREAAEILGKQRMSAQAAGGAVGKNPIGIIIPCHRVLGANGKLTGYAGGIEKKIFLLRLEGVSFTE